MADSSADELPSPAREVLEPVRSRSERLENALREVLDHDTDDKQPRLRHRSRIRLLGESTLAHGLPEERRAAVEKSSGDDGPFVDFNALRIDGWRLDANSRWWPPDDPGVGLGFNDIAPSSDPRAIVMDDNLLHEMIDALSQYLAKNVPKLQQPLFAVKSMATSLAAAREGMRLLLEAKKLRERELDSDQRKRRHAQRLVLIGLEMARRGVRETQLEPIRRGSGLAELLFENLTLTKDGWTRSADGRWTAPADESDPTPPASG